MQKLGGHEQVGSSSQMMPKPPHATETPSDSQPALSADEEDYYKPCIIVEKP